MPQDSIFRGISLLVFLSSIVISSYHRKRARRSGDVIPRRAEGAFVLLIRMGAGLVVAASFLAYPFAPARLAWSSLSMPTWLRWIAGGVALACLPAIWWVLVSIGENISETVLVKANHRLVTHGPYHWIRHPLYAVALVELLSLAIIAGSWYLLLLACAAILVFRIVVIPKEEDNLVRAFGKPYEEYKRRTGALLPRLRPPPPYPPPRER
jgi:protein-S-isoprenylcysteine O-methyltransferase Ste14